MAGLAAKSIPLYREAKGPKQPQLAAYVETSGSSLGIIPTVINQNTCTHFASADRHNVPWSLLQCSKCVATLLDNILVGIEKAI